MTPTIPKEPVDSIEREEESVAARNLRESRKLGKLMRESGERVVRGLRRAAQSEKPSDRPEGLILPEKGPSAHSSAARPPEGLTLPETRGGLGPLNR